MKRIIAIVFILAIVPLGVSYSQDTIYGDYMKSTNVDPQDNVYGDYILASSTKVISLDLEDASLVDVLKMLSQQTGLNFVSTEAVEARTLTLYVEKVPLKEALDVMFKANNLAYDYYPESNMFVVKEMGKPTMELRAKVYRLQYVRVESVRMQGEIDTLMEPEDAEDEDDDGGTDETQGIKGAVENVLTEFGKVSEDPITNSLIVVDVPSQFPLIDEVVKSLDIPVPQVMLEVEVLDVAKSDLDEIGIKWANPIFSLDVTGAKAVKAPFGRHGTSGSGMQFTDITTPSGNYDISWAANRFAPSIFTAIGQNLEFDFLNTLQDTKLLARPKVLTLSNETAEIKLIIDEAISVTRNVNDDNNETTYTVDRKELGTKLRVTPQVDVYTGDITLFVDISVSDAVNSDFTVTDPQLTGQIKDPQERVAKSIARLKPGETLLMGGLIRNNKTKEVVKLPILGDIPFLGRFFRHDRIDEDERELLVFITPRIIDQGIGSTARMSTPHREQQYSYRGDAMRAALNKLSAY